MLSPFSPKTTCHAQNHDHRLALLGLVALYQRHGYNLLPYRLFLCQTLSPQNHQLICQPSQSQDHQQLPPLHHQHYPQLHHQQLPPQNLPNSPLASILGPAIAVLAIAPHKTTTQVFNPLITNPFIKLRFKACLAHLDKNIYTTILLEALLQIIKISQKSQ